uniref:Transposase n=1 Tax=Mesocestoides corti TaxID=53468 RepID=A0A5K3F0C3_MESCO
MLLIIRPCLWLAADHSHRPFKQKDRGLTALDMIQYVWTVLWHHSLPANSAMKI